MFYNNKRTTTTSMATLLQQKNCITTLTNGTVNGNNGTSPSANESNNSTNNETTLLTAHHDIVTIPSSSSSVEIVNSLINQSNNLSGGGNGNHHQQQFHHNSMDSFQNFDLINSNSSHHFNNHHHHMQPFTTRYFSQFSNNQNSSEFLYHNMSTSSPSLTTTSISANGITSTATTTHSNYTTVNDKHNSLLFNQGPSISTTPFSSLMSITSQQQQQQQSQNHQNKDDGRIKSDDDFKMQDRQQIGTEERTIAEKTDVQHQSQQEQQQQQQETEQEEPEPEIDIVINNVVCSFSVRCHLNLREIALNGFNVEFRRENGMVTMKLRRPYTTASIWSSGRITCTGATSEEQAKIAARRYARCLQKLGFSVRFHNFRVVNVLGTCSMPWAIKIVNFSEKYKKDASYEPELHPGVTYKLKYPKATLKIFSTGSITVTAGSVAHVQAAIEHIFPLVYEFRKKRTPEELEILRAKQSSTTTEEIVNNDEFLHSPSQSKTKRPPGCAENDPEENIMYVSDYEDDPDDPE